MLASEVHTFAFSVAANAILSFIPFAVLLYTFSLGVFHSRAMVGIVTDMVNFLLPALTQDPKWIANSIENVAALSSRRGIQFISMVMILISCTGIFLPLEVALNQAWGISKSRNYIMNQIVSLGLAAWVLVLGMTIIGVNLLCRQPLFYIWVRRQFGLSYTTYSFSLLVVTTVVASILFFFSIYWLLPNRTIAPGPVFRSAVVTGILWILSKYIFELVLPHMDLKALYGPFYVSVGLLFWSYVSGLILFAGAQFSVARADSVH
jgi:YihY family inner membrane protein